LNDQIRSRLRAIYPYTLGRTRRCPDRPSITAVDAQQLFAHEAIALLIRPIVSEPTIGSNECKSSAVPRVGHGASTSRPWRFRSGSSWAIKYQEMIWCIGNGGWIHVSRPTC